MDRFTLFRAPFSEQRRDSHALLWAAARAHTGLSAEHLGELCTNQWGKPAFSRAEQLHFSLTHSGRWWLCAFGAQPLGLDLQIHRSHTPPDRLSRRFFHPRENSWLAQEDYARFFDLWCAKESWVKYTGTGFHQDPSAFSVVAEDGRFPAMEGVDFRLLPFGPGHSLCLCARRIDRVLFRTLPD